MGTEPIMRYFEYAHLPSHLQHTSRRFHDLAHDLVNALPRNPERTVALRKLLEAKDAAVRAGLPEPTDNVITEPLELDEVMEITKADIDLDGPPDFR